MSDSKKSILPKISFWLGLSSIALFVIPFSFILSLSAIMCGLISSFRKDAEKQRSYYFIGTLTGLGSLIFIGITPALMGGLGKDIRMECSANLKIIGIALHSYSNDYGGEFPPYGGAKGMNLLWKQGYIKNSSVFTCPSIPAKYAKEGADLTENNLGYFYRSPFKDKNTDLYDVPIVWDKMGSHKSLKSYSILEAYRKLYFPKKTDDEFIYKNVLDIDGHVCGFVGKSWKKDAGIIKTGKETGSEQNK